MQHHTSAPRQRGLRQPVLALLLAGLLAAALGPAFLNIAPNRLLSGQGVPLVRLPDGAWWGLLLPLAWLVAALLLPARRALLAASAVAAAVLLAGLVALAGGEAAQRAAVLPALARVSLGSGFWLALLCLWAAAADALRQLGLGRWPHAAAHALLWLLPALLLAGGALDALSLLKEYANRQDVFVGALGRHLHIVGAALVPALLIGVPMGWLATRSERLASPLFATLGIVQTLPSIALFGLLMAPLAWLGQVWPASGLQGIGLAPALVALTLYALLPIVHGVAAGLQQVPAALLEAATAMGMSRGQRLRQVTLPLALPVLMSALRLTAVQLIGLAVVAALIGAGGLGSLVFQGLLGSAHDLVLLGVLPVVALALGVDALLRLLTPAPLVPQR